MKRDPGRTRQRILSAALREFAAKGFAGARIDVIARQARVNKRMLYHYFGDKRDLYREVFRRKLAEKTEVTRRNPEDPARAMPYWFQDIRGDQDWVRLLAWESLVGSPRAVAHEEHRRLYVEALGWLGDAQDRGLVSPAFDPEVLMLAFISLNLFPLAFPQVTRALTGLSPTEPAFEEKHAQLVQRLAERLRSLPGEREHRDAHAHVGLEPSGSGEARQRREL